MTRLVCHLSLFWSIFEKKAVPCRCCKLTRSLAFRCACDGLWPLLSSTIMRFGRHSFGPVIGRIRRHRSTTCRRNYHERLAKKAAQKQQAMCVIRQFQTSIQMSIQSRAPDAQAFPLFMRLAATRLHTGSSACAPLCVCVCVCVCVCLPTVLRAWLTDCTWTNKN